MNHNNDKVLHIPRLERPPNLENFLSMEPVGEVEEKMVKASGFTQREPSDGEPATMPMEVYLGYDDDNLYIVYVAYDDPTKVRARLSRRENVFRDDTVEIMLDTFNDQRRAYAFVTNPLGVQWDAIWTEGGGFDDSFDTLWYSDGKLTDEGFVVWMAIPFKSLRFPSGTEQEWGIILFRETQRGSGEFSSWPWVSERIEGRLNQAGTLKINTQISAGRNIRLIPYTTYRTFRLLDRNDTSRQDFVTDSFDPDAGVDAKFVLKDKFTVDATINPDFNQVESDQPQITVNRRFEVFFEEKRPFFLENANFFQTPYNLVFTRRIREPQFGARFTGKTGNYTIGALLSNDEAPGKSIEAGEPGHNKNATFGIFRITRDIFSQSSIGVLFTDREFAGSYNRVGGIDGRFKLTDNWTSEAQAVWSRTKNNMGEIKSDPAFRFELNRSGRQFNASYEYQEVGRDFHTASGFVNRTDFRELTFFHGYSFRPEGKVLISWGPRLFMGRLWDTNNLRLDEEIEGSLEFNLSGDTEFNVEYQYGKERLRPRDFDGLIENIDFEQERWSLGFQTSLIDQFQLEADLSFGSSANFEPPDGQLPHLSDFIENEFALNLLPITQLRIDNSVLFFRLNEKNTGRKILSNRIFRSRWSWHFNRRLSLRLIFQYDVTSVDPALTSEESGKNFNVDFLLTYLVNPWTALYAGVNSNYENPNDPRNPFRRPNDDFLNDGRQFFVKYSYLFQF